MTHYLRTFEHLAPPEKKVAPPHRSRRRAWIALPVLALLTLAWAMRSGDEPQPSQEAGKRGNAPRIALAPSRPQAQQHPQPSQAVPPVRVVERPGPKLIERMLAEKFGTELPKPTAAPPQRPEPPEVAIARPAIPPPPPPLVDRPDPSERPRVAEPPAPLQVVDRPALSEKPREAEKPKAEKVQRAEKPEKAKKPEMIARAPARLTAPLTTSRAEPLDEAENESDAEAPMAAATREEPTPARLKPVVTQRAERARPVEPERAGAEATVVTEKPAVTERPLVTERPIAVVERAVAAPVAVQPAVVATATRGEAAPVEAERVAVAVRTTAGRAAGPTDDAVRSLLDRYAAAWRGHDVDTLRAIGQVTNDGQAAALRQYFANVGDLEVEVRVLDIRTDGDRATVRFTRRDTFKDPTGRSIAKESPPIEKVVVTTPQGLRFGPAS